MMDCRRWGDDGMTVDAMTVGEETHELLFITFHPACLKNQRVGRAGILLTTPELPTNQPKYTYPITTYTYLLFY